MKQWCICGKNESNPTDELSTPFIFYGRSCISNFAHPSHGTPTLYMFSSKSLSLQAAAEESTENISVSFMCYLCAVSIFYSSGTALSVSVVIFHPHYSMKPYSKRPQCLLYKTALQTSAHSTVLHLNFYTRLGQIYYLRLTHRQVIVFFSTKLFSTIIIAISHAECSRAHHFPAELQVIAPCLSVDRYIDHMDPVLMRKRKERSYGIETEGYPHVGGYVCLRWQEDKKCYPCRIVYYNPGKDYATVI